MLGGVPPHPPAPIPKVRGLLNCQFLRFLTGCSDHTGEGCILTWPAITGMLMLSGAAVICKANDISQHKCCLQPVLYNKQNTIEKSAVISSAVPER